MNREHENRNKLAQKAAERSSTKDQADGQGEGHPDPFAAGRSATPLDETAEPEGQFPAPAGDRGHVA
jgi:hypothetical protein